MDTPWQSLEGKVVMVTGASSGIGREICLDLAAAGCRIVAAARRTDRLRSLCQQINGAAAVAAPAEASSVRSVAVELDVSAPGPAIDAAVQKAWDAFGRIDALVNNAGVRGGVHSPLDWPEEEWNEIVRTNLTGVWQVSKHVCARMRDAKHKGSVINIGSIAGIVRGQLPGSLAYSASKSGINALTRVMALELGGCQVRVNSINPGLFKSEITQGLMDKPWLDKVMKRTIPLGTSGPANPALTSVVRYLIHDASDYVTGNTFIVDAGATLPGIPIFSSL